jgi:hypothetical protein
MNALARLLDRLEDRFVPRGDPQMRRLEAMEKT